MALAQAPQVMMLGAVPDQEAKPHSGRRTTKSRPGESWEKGGGNYTSSFGPLLGQFAGWPMWHVRLAQGSSLKPQKAEVTSWGTGRTKTHTTQNPFWNAGSSTVAYGMLCSGSCKWQPTHARIQSAHPKLQQRTTLDGFKGNLPMVFEGLQLVSSP